MRFPWLMTSAVTMILVMVVAYAMLLRVPRHRWRLHGLLHASIGLALVVEVVGRVMASNSMNSIALYNLFLPVEFLLVLGMVAQVRPAWRWRLVAGAAIGLAGWAGCWIMTRSLSFLLIEGALLISLVLSFTLMATLWSLANTSERPLARVPEFWLYMGMLVYFGGMMPVVGLVKFIFDQDPLVAARLWMILPVLCMVRYALTAYACRMAAKELSVDHER
jgi:hypothetical protein